MDRHATDHFRHCWRWEGGGGGTEPAGWGCNSHSCWTMRGMHVACWSAVFVVVMVPLLHLMRGFLLESTPNRASAPDHSCTYSMNAHGRTHGSGAPCARRRPDHAPPQTRLCVLTCSLVNISAVSVAHRGFQCVRLSVRVLALASSCILEGRRQAHISLLVRCRLNRHSSRYEIVFLHLL